MKKKIITALLSTTLALNIFLPNVHAAESKIIEMNDVIVTINGIQVSFDVPPAMKDDRTLVPLRAIFEAMGASVRWDNVSQTVFATKEDKSIELTINSNVAKKGDTEMQLDVPATIYKERTLVPLRFIGEAFDGTVAWDGITKHVKITLPDAPVTPVTQTSIYVNNKKLDFDNFSPIVRNKITYIPIESVLDNLTTNELYWERQGDKVYVQLDGIDIYLYIGKNYAMIDGVQVEMSQPLIEFEGRVLAPTNAIAKILGGNSVFDEETQAIYLYINRAKFLHEFLTKEQVKFAQPTNVVGTSFVGNRRIMVSDNPENLNERTVSEDNDTLWQDEVRSSNASIDHRVFGWHINEFPQGITIGITIENLSSTNEIEVVGLKGTSRQTPNGWVNYDIGLPLAEKMLSGKVTTVKMSSPIVKPGKTALMQSFNVLQSNTIGFQYDFTVRKKSGSGELNYKIRTVVSKDETDLTTILNDPVEIDKTALHPRGVWSSSQLRTELPPYEAGSEETAYQISNGATDNLMSVDNGIGDQTQMVKNPGHFGASYIVSIPILNKTGESKTVRVRVGARGGIYNGAVKVDGKVYLIPTLTPMTETANIIDYVIDKESGMIELEIMHAGGSALPLAIDLITLEPPKPEIPDPTDSTDQSDPSDVSETSNTSETTDSSDTLDQQVEVE